MEAMLAGVERALQNGLTSASRRGARAGQAWEGLSALFDPHRYDQEHASRRAPARMGGRPGTR